MRDGESEAPNTIQATLFLSQDRAQVHEDICVGKAEQLGLAAEVGIGTYRGEGDWAGGQRWRKTQR